MISVPVQSDHLHLLLEILTTGTLGGQRDNTLLAGHISQAARVLGITMNLDQNQEMTEDFTEEKNFLVSLNANHIEAYAIKSFNPSSGPTCISGLTN